MRYLLVGLLLLASSALAGDLIGQPAPAFRGETLAGEPFDLADYLGKTPIVVHFWTSWCSPCRDEAPYWAWAQREHGDRVLIVGVNMTFQDTPDEARSFVKAYRWDFPVLADGTHAVAAAYGVVVTTSPTTFFIGIDGTVVGRRIGAYKDKDAIEQDLLRLIHWRP